MWRRRSRLRLTAPFPSTPSRAAPRAQTRVTRFRSRTGRTSLLRLGQFVAVIRTHAIEAQKTRALVARAGHGIRTIGHQQHRVAALEHPLIGVEADADRALHDI